MFQLLKIDNLPRPVRHKRRSLENTPEWIEMQKRLGKGLKPYEAAATIFSPEQITQLDVKTAPKVFLDMCKEYISEHKLKLDAWKYKAEDGSQVIVVADRVLLLNSNAAASRISAIDAHNQRTGTHRGPGRPRKAA